MAPRRACRRIRLPVRTSGSKLPVGWVTCGRAIGILKTPLPVPAVASVANVFWMTRANLRETRRTVSRDDRQVPGQARQALARRRQGPASRRTRRQMPCAAAHRPCRPCRTTPPSPLGPDACQSARPRDSQRNPTWSSGVLLAAPGQPASVASGGFGGGTGLANNDVDIAPERVEQALR